MIPAIKAEFRKVFTVRSTLFIMLFVVGLQLLFGFYGSGYKANAEIIASNPDFLAMQIPQALAAVTFLGAIIALLLVTHEYRYNTIMYTLTSTRTRAQVLFSKLSVISCVALIFALFVVISSPLLVWAGVELKGLHMIDQNIPVWSLLWRSVAFTWCVFMVGSMIAFLVRNQVAAIVSFFIVPGTFEGLLSILLKDDRAYLPFTAMQQIINHEYNSETARQIMSYAQAGSLSLVYLSIMLLLTWFLFKRRDAN